MQKTKNIFEALTAIMAEVEHIGKNKTNQQQGYKFRGIDDMYNALHPYFAKHGVFITSNVVESKREERQTQKGGTLIYTIATCQFTFYAMDGSFITSTIEGEAMDSGDKSTNKAMSTALKYALMQMFLIPTEEKIDTEYQTHEVAPEKIDLSIWETLVNGCNTVDELNHAYKQNKSVVDKTPKIRALFSNRKTQI
jgi:hypothetical protein